ncbi:uncharacterized protein LOC113319929 isoform X1 [Papaver somniferum]|uniref:uncharacterized protein LOC113319929 isoform X1 n=1 Tax=Papaver somniferum TaxID=3469 RepID=UPI000E700BF6|nr:uncharacterized protein LOC113319929 isoform X1 [Papaver somniferum]
MIQPSTNYTNAETIVGGGSAKFWTKRKYEERTEELKSLTKTREPVVKTWASKRRKMVTKGDRFVDETSNEPATNDNCDSDGIVEGGSPKIGTKSKNVVRAKGSGEPVIQLESVELYKSRCFELFMEREKNKMELEKMKMELEKKKSECTELQDKLAEVEETRNSTPRDEDATKYWMNKCSDLESLVLRMENENSTMRRVVSNLESLVQRTGKESSILRCQELRNSEKIESEALGLQNEITQTGDKQRDKNNKSKPSAEISGGWGKDSRTYELKTKEKVLNVNDWAGLEERPSQHRSPSQAHLEMSKMTFVNLLSDSVDAGDSLSESEEIDCLIDSKISLSDPMDMLALKNLNMNNDEMKWKSEADMLSSFEKDTELCMKAICALYRQQISEDEISLKGLVIDEDMHRYIKNSAHFSSICNSIIL